MVIHRMCDTCHRKQDPEFPSPLIYERGRERCGDCHGAVEGPDLGWLEEAGRGVRIAALKCPPGQDVASETVRQAFAADLAKYRFSTDAPSETDLLLELSVEPRRLRETRFVPPGWAVFRCTIEAKAGYPGEAKPVFARRAVSVPRVGKTEEEAARRAAADAYHVLRGPLLEALATR